jgi:hypothetical protein
VSPYIPIGIADDLRILHSRRVKIRDLSAPRPCTSSRPGQRVEGAEYMCKRIQQSPPASHSAVVSPSPRCSFHSPTAPVRADDCNRFPPSTPGGRVNSFLGRSVVQSGGSASPQWAAMVMGFVQKLIAVSWSPPTPVPGEARSPAPSCAGERTRGRAVAVIEALAKANHNAVRRQACHEHQRHTQRRPLRLSGGARGSAS